MKHLLLSLLSVGLLVPGVSADTPLPTPDYATITLSRFDMSLVHNAKQQFRSRMHKIRAGLAVPPTLVTAGLLYWAWSAWSKNKEKTSAEQHWQNYVQPWFEAGKAKTTVALTAQQGAPATAPTHFLVDGGTRRIPHAELSVADIEIARNAAIAEYEHRYGRTQSADGAPNAVRNNGMFSPIFWQILQIGLAGIIIVAGHRLFDFLIDTLKEGGRLAFRGYNHWHTMLEAQAKLLISGLFDTVQQARKAALQTTTEQQLMLARQQRRGAPLRDASTHFRMDIVTSYQQLLHTFSQLVAVVLIIAPPAQHQLILQHVSVVAKRLDAVAESLETDLNESFYGMIIHYSNHTVDMLAACMEALTIFLTSTRTYLTS